MRRLNMLIVMTAMVFVAAGSARGNTSLGPMKLDSRAVATSVLSSLPAVKGDESLSKTIFHAGSNSTGGSVFFTASAQDGKGDGKNDKTDKNPPTPPPPPPPDPPRSKSCPPAPGDDPRDRNCGKGNDGKL